jgi:hypothetical protein
LQQGHGTFSDFLPSKILDAGPVLNLKGPHGTVPIPKDQQGSYLAQWGGHVVFPDGPSRKPLYLYPGTYTIDNGGGGADIGSFTTTLTVPSPAFVWTNADANLTVTLSAGVDIKWSGGDPYAPVAIIGSVNPSTGEGGDFYCEVPNNGEFFVTSEVLALLPVSPTDPGSISMLSVGSQSSTTFSAPGLDSGTVLFETLYTRSVVYH